jgi:hypothetical protein
MTSRIHFLIPFKSNFTYLRETLLSVGSQTIHDWSATVFNDSPCARDVEQLVSSFSDDRMTFVHNQSPLGIAGNWNTALSSTNAEFATLVHADDILTPTYAAKVLSLHKLHPDTYGVFTGVRIIDQRGAPMRFSIPDVAKKMLHPFLPEPCIVAGDKGLRTLLRGDFIFCPTVTYRVDRLRHPVFDKSLRMSLDLQSFADAILRGEQFVGTKDTHYLYRRHPTSTTSILNSDSSRFIEELQTYRRIASDASRQNFSASARTAERAAVVKGHIVITALTSVTHGRFEQARRCIGLLQS